MSELAKKECVPCAGGVPPLSEEECNKLLPELDGWMLIDGHHLHKDYEFKNFVQALSWVNAIGEIAEAENHHPDIELGWGYVRVSVWTHKIDGLTEADFVFAAKLDAAEESGD